MLSKILNLVGIVLMLMVIAVTIPLTVPKWFGYQIYGVLTGSMEPEYPVGSVVYVKAVPMEEIQVGDCITFSMGADSELVNTHRVVEKDEEKQEFITKGDANSANDANPVGYQRVVGKAMYCLPGFGELSTFIHSQKGLAIGISTFSVSLICWTLGDILKKKSTKK